MAALFLSLAGCGGLDGHSRSDVECKRVLNKDGKRVLLSSTGTVLNHIGYLLIDQDGNPSTGFVSDYTQKDADIPRLSVARAGSGFLADGYLEDTPLYAQAYGSDRIVVVP